MRAARKLCDRRGLSFAHLFARQYCLTEDLSDCPESWVQTPQMMGWGIAHCPKLECRPLLDRGGSPVGWLLGVAIDQNGQMVAKDSAALDAAQDQRDFWDRAEAEISAWAGRYIAVLITPMGKRVYFDPVMDLPAVFHASERLVAASPLMALRENVQINERTNHKLIIREGGHYGLQQTCDPDVLRALSNHYLDLDDFTLHRHWPGPDDRFDAPPRSVEETGALIAARLGQITGAMLETYACLVPLSGGHDSRTLAFSAKSKMPLARGFFSHRTNWMTGLDCYIATLVAAELGVEHQIIDAVELLRRNTVSRDDLRALRWEFCHRTGYQHPPSQAEQVASSMLPDADYVLRGNILDMSRANQWPRDNTFSVAHGLSKLAIGGRPADASVDDWRADYTRWLETLPPLAKARAYEFAFVEQLLPNTLGGRLLGYQKAAYMNPFNDRGLITACMQVDPKTRKSGALNAAIQQACGMPRLPFTSEIKTDDAHKANVRALFRSLQSA